MSKAHSTVAIADTCYRSWTHPHSNPPLLISTSPNWPQTLHLPTPTHLPHKKVITHSGRISMLNPKYT